MQSVLIESAYQGEPNLTVTLTRDGDDSPWHPGKPRYAWSVTDGSYTLSGDDLCGWGDAADMARALCSFLSNDVERQQYAEHHGRQTDVNGDPLPDYGPEGWAFLISHSETLTMGSMEE